MYQRILLSTLIVCATGLFSGCGKIVETIPYGEVTPSPISMACAEYDECKLTDELYHPCGSVHSIHINTPQSSIDAYNEAQMKLGGGVDYDCDFPPLVHEYVSLCHNQMCGSAKIEK